MYDQTKADRIIGGIARGELLSDICALIGVTRQTVWNWQQSNQTFLDQYAHAREQSALVNEEDISRLMGEVRTGGVAPDAARVILNGMTWLAKVRAPKVYGEKVQNEHSGTMKVVAVQTDVL